MKVEVISEEKLFQPIEIKLVIESEEELCNLWHRMNSKSEYIMNGSNDILKHEASKNLYFFEVLNDLIIIKKLKKPSY